MNDNQILVVHNRWVYNFMGITLEAQVSLMVSLLCILFKKLVSDFGDFQTLYGGRKSIEKALHANECVRWIEAFIANLGHPLWGSQSIQELASGMRNILPFLIRDASPIKDVPDLQWMPPFISPSFACSAFSMDFLLWTFFHHIGFSWVISRSSVTVESISPFFGWFSFFEG